MTDTMLSKNCLFLSFLYFSAAQKMIYCEKIGRKRMDALQEKRNLLKAAILKQVAETGTFDTGIDGVHVAVHTQPSVCRHCMYKPMAIFVLQGAKQTSFGAQQYIYGENQLIVAAVDLPAVSGVIEASPEKPYICVVTDLNDGVIGDLLVESPAPADIAAGHGMGVEPIDENLTDALYRLISLSNQPERRKIIAPMILKEIHYLLLTSSLGGILRSVHTKGAHNNQIAHAIDWLKENFRAPLKIDELAQRFNMAESSFYRHFSKVTNLSPLQYQKRLRLQEAQRLMLSENFSAENAGYEVGYESASQFNREYKRMFGIPPRADVNRLRTV